ncbi:MAG: signal recognition particle subunit SRP19/SEC65 family protein [Methanocalculaceae archaeon]|jgi:signal recognition particle subunit SRP19|nr:signal recognition particle subunit SRP19/SEC65 family protein [Methanocalculaceae archaeon]
MAIRFLYPCYFHAELTRSEGRRVAKTLAVASPSLVQVARAAKQCGLTVLVEERDVAHPAHWFLHDGRLRVEYAGNKEELLRSVARKLSGN